MPNWATTDVYVTLPTENADKFLDLFLSFDTPEVNKAKQQYLARSFIYTDGPDINRYENEDGTTDLDFVCDCAWSIWSCWVDGYPNGKECLTMEEYCKQLGVKSLSAESEELGMMFREHYEYTEGVGANINSHEITDAEYKERYGDDDEDDEIDQKIFDPCASKKEAEMG